MAIGLCIPCSSPLPLMRAMAVQFGVFGWWKVSKICCTIEHQLPMISSTSSSGRGEYSRTVKYESRIAMQSWWTK